jgi:hypothetical protein
MRSVPGGRIGVPTVIRTFRSPQAEVDWKGARHGKSFSVPVYVPDGKAAIDAAL